MKKKYISEIKRINYLTNELDSLYHKSSLKLGIADSVSIVLYTIYDSGNECLLTEIYKQSGISKQTVNSAIRGLEVDGILYLQQHTGRSKKVILTDKGKAYVQRTSVRLQQAEMDAFDTWTEEEISTYIRLMEKYAECFRLEIEKL